MAWGSPRQGMDFAALGEGFMNPLGRLFLFCAGGRIRLTGETKPISTYSCIIAYIMRSMVVVYPGAASRSAVPANDNAPSPRRAAGIAWHLVLGCLLAALGATRLGFLRAGM